MPNRSRKRKPLDLNLLAQAVVEEATGNTPEPTEPEEPTKNPAAVELGRLGGLKGGKARWKGTTKKQRSEAAREAARARWRKQSQ